MFNNKVLTNIIYTDCSFNYFCFDENAMKYFVKIWCLWLSQANTHNVHDECILAKTYYIENMLCPRWIKGNNKQQK